MFSKWRPDYGCIRWKMICDCQHIRWASRLASKSLSRSGKPVKPFKQNIKYGISRLLKNKKEPTPRRTLGNAWLRTTQHGPDSPKGQKETVSKGRRAIIIEPSCSENPAFKPDEKVDFKYRVSSFGALGLQEDVLKALDSVRVTHPTVIQMVTIPQILQRNHVLCAAQTGTGKTLAYLAPIVHHLREEEEKHGLISRVKRPRACVVVPARELAVQILQTAKALCHYARFRSIGIIGGRKKKLMKTGLSSPVDLIVATPGTLLKFRQKDHLFFSDLSYLVIDEADTMFDHSFKSLTEELLKSIHIREETPSAQDQLPVDTQVIIVGATLPREILVNTLKDMLPHLQVCTSGLHRVLPHIRHKFLKLRHQDKAARLLKVLRKDLKMSDRRVVVFCNTAISCDFVSHLLTNRGISFIRLHGNIPAKERSDLFEEFQHRKANILVCTDIASRGLDTIDVSHVINFDFPSSLADYIHRVGRTGRVGNATAPTEVSVATSLVSHNRDVRMAKVIEEAAKKQKSLENIEIRPKPPSLNPERLSEDAEIVAKKHARENRRSFASSS